MFTAGPTADKERKIVQPIALYNAGTIVHEYGLVGIVIIIVKHVCVYNLVDV